MFDDEAGLHDDDVQEMKVRMTRCEVKLDGVVEQLHKFEKRFDRFEEKIDTRFEKFDARLERTEEKLDRKMDKLSNEIGSLKNWFATAFLALVVLLGGSLVPLWLRLPPAAPAAAAAPAPVAPAAHP
ncbi:MAG: hypothetical protein ACXU8N_09605 [Telluria sp.]